MISFPVAMVRADAADSAFFLAFFVLVMMCAPFRQQIDKEGSELGVAETRHGLAIHYDVIRNTLVSARGIDVIGARAGAYNTVSHCSALRWLGERGVTRTLFRRSPRIHLSRC